MAKKTTNDAKRVEMANIMAGVFQKGWKPAEVAAVMGVTASCISSWKSGKSMGTNAQRATLMTFAGRDTTWAKELMEKTVQRAQDNLNHERDYLNREASEAGYQGFLNDHMESSLHSIEYHTRELPNSRDEWNRNYHTKALAEYQAKTPEIIAAEAREHQAASVAWQEKKVAKAAKYLKDMEKVLAKW